MIWKNLINSSTKGMSIATASTKFFYQNRQTKIVNFSKKRITDQGFILLFQIESLSRLSVNQNTMKVAENFDELPFSNIETLHLHCCAIQATIERFYESIFTVLDISRNNIQDDGLVIPQKYSHLVDTIPKAEIGIEDSPMYIEYQKPHIQSTNAQLRMYT